MLRCHCPTKHVGKLRSAICLRGHLIQVCLDPACLEIAMPCPIPGCKSPVALWHRPADRPLPLSLPNTKHLGPASRRAHTIDPSIGPPA
jgi:hypothetical protein